MKTRDMFPDLPAQADWRRRAERAEQEAARLREHIRAAEASLLALYVLITATGELTWHVDLPTSDPVGGAVHRAGETLDTLRAVIERDARGGYHD
jgi:hypothetical protein